MFGLFNIDKILVLAIILVIVWQGFKLLGRVEESRRQARSRAAAGTAAGAKHSVITPVEDMIKCPTCGDYVPKLQARTCQKPNCPY
jgi:hypothetical protein